MSAVATPPRARARVVLLRLVRSAGAGGVATLVDFASLTTMVSFCGVPPRVASVPALVAGSVVMFFGQKHFVFRTRPGNATRELVLFAIVQAAGLALNALLYDQALRRSALASQYYIGTRFVTTNLVWLAFSFPAWHFVFRERAAHAQEPTAHSDS